MKALIIEDEKMAQANLARLLKNSFPEMEIVAMIDSVRGAVEFLSARPKLDVIFMDVELSDGICFEIFRSIGTTRLNELAKLYGVYDRKETKADRIRRLSDLPEADDIIFNEIAIERYGSVEDMKNAFNKLPEKRKRGRPKKAS